MAKIEPSTTRAIGMSDFMLARFYRSSASLGSSELPQSSFRTFQRLVTRKGAFIS
jgi:hypothetical protein